MNFIQNVLLGNPLHGDSYQWWSGIGSDIGELTIVAGMVVLIRHHICHVDGCRKLGHMDSAVQAPACRKHHSAREKRGKV